MPHHPHIPRTAGRPHGVHRGRIVAHYAPELPREEFASALMNLGELLLNNARVTVNDVPIKVPSSVEFQLVYERTPHGTLKLKVEADWPEEYGATTSSESRVLTFGAFAEDGE